MQKYSFKYSNHSTKMKQWKSENFPNLLGQLDIINIFQTQEELINDQYKEMKEDDAIFKSFLQYMQMSGDVDQIAYKVKSKEAELLQFTNQFQQYDYPIYLGRNLSYQHLKNKTVQISFQQSKGDFDDQLVTDFIGSQQLITCRIPNLSNAIQNNKQKLIYSLCKRAFVNACASQPSCLLIDSPSLIQGQSPFISFNAVFLALKELLNLLIKNNIMINVVLNLNSKYDQFLAENLLPVYFPLSTEHNDLQSHQIQFQQEREMQRLKDQTCYLENKKQNSRIFDCLQRWESYMPAGIYQIQKVKSGMEMLLERISNCTLQFSSQNFIQKLHGDRKCYIVKSFKIQNQSIEDLYLMFLGQIDLLAQDPVYVVVLGSNYKLRCYLKSLQNFPLQRRLKVCVIKSSLDNEQVMEWKNILGLSEIVNLQSVKQMTEYESFNWIKLDFENRQWENEQ